MIINRDTARKCNKCGEWKPLEEFAKDKNRKQDRAYTCKECLRENTKKMYRKRCDPKTIFKKNKLHMMTDDAFVMFYNDCDLKEYIKKQAIRYSKSDKERQKDLQQVAWGRIALCEQGMSNEYYKKVAGKAIFNEYRRAWRIKEYGLGYSESMTFDEVMLWRHGVG